MIQGSLTKMDGVSAARGLTTFSRSGNLIIDTFIQSYSFIIGIGALPIRLYFRENLGERAFSPFALIVCIIFYFFIGLIGGFIVNELVFRMIKGDIISNTNNIGFSSLINLLLLSPVFIFLLFTASMGVKHLRRVFREAEESDVVRYSYYRGDSRYYKDFIGKVSVFGKVHTEQSVRMNFEPKIAAIKGGLILFISVLVSSTLIFLDFNIIGPYFRIYLGFIHITGVMIILGSLCLYLEEFGIMLRVRGKVLDMIDGEYDMMFIKAERDRLKLTTEGDESSNKSIVNRLSDDSSIVVE